MDLAEHPTQILIASIGQNAAEPLPPSDDPAFGVCFDRFAMSRVVLLGEAPHGTSEFYRARAAITRRLIERHGFTVVAVKADGPDAAAIDRYMRWRPQQQMGSAQFAHVPNWMWRNTDVDAFMAFLRRHNMNESAENQIAFYGPDLYTITASISAVPVCLNRVRPRPQRRRASAMQATHPGHGCRLPMKGHRPINAKRSAKSRRPAASLT
jgi:putative phosphoribosyl transferase